MPLKFTSAKIAEVDSGCGSFMEIDLHNHEHLNLLSQP